MPSAFVTIALNRQLSLSRRGAYFYTPTEFLGVMPTPQAKPTASAFTRWRPQFHLIAPNNWLNDPCGPGYDPCKKKYHLAYQWNPNDNEWGDICWGRATSSDLVSWEIDAEPCLAPSAPYDNKGIFTGCFQSTNLQGQQDGALIYFYTSVKSLPIHYTLPYSNGCETLSIALSRDAGHTWERHAQNPILPGPPAGLQVYGWRDPFICPWPSAPESVRRAAQQVAGQEDVMYGFISGGLVNHTPTVFVYAITRNALTEWKYIGILLDVGLNYIPSRWSGDLGVNWEVSNLVTLTNDEGTYRDFLIMGVEGCIPNSNTNRPTARDRRIQRSQLWTCMKQNTIPDQTQTALMQPSFSGIFDSGLFYAANSFFDPVTQRQVVFGWITEEDLPDETRKEQGWSGLVSLPRMLTLQTIHRVKRARSTATLGNITSIEAVPDGQGTYTVYTLGVGLDSRVESLRRSATVFTRGNLDLSPDLDEADTATAMTTNTQSSGPFVPLSTMRWEVDAEIAVGRDCGRVGMVIFHDEDYTFKTILFWDPLHETFQVDRPRPSTINTDINHGPEVTPHTLFTYINPAATTNDSTASERETETEEPLRIHALFDTSVLEIFVNGRTAITTRIYHSEGRAGADGPTCVGVRFYAEGAGCDTDSGGGGGGEEIPARLLHAAIWDGLACL
ncbi:glycosyl hydrolase [Aspergillus falconensis]